jgi:hypothetical protein
MSPVYDRGERAVIVLRTSRNPQDAGRGIAVEGYLFRIAMHVKSFSSISRARLQLASRDDHASISGFLEVAPAQAKSVDDELSDSRVAMRIELKRLRLKKDAQLTDIVMVPRFLKHVPELSAWRDELEPTH